jgi:hypothetical protein
VLVAVVAGVVVVCAEAEAAAAALLPLEAVAAAVVLAEQDMAVVEAVAMGRALGCMRETVAAVLHLRHTRMEVQGMTAGLTLTHSWHVMGGNCDDMVNMLKAESNGFGSTVTTRCDLLFIDGSSAVLLCLRADIIWIKAAFTRCTASLCTASQCTVLHSAALHDAVTASHYTARHHTAAPLRNILMDIVLEFWASSNQARQCKNDYSGSMLQKTLVCVRELGSMFLVL